MRHSLTSPRTKPADENRPIVLRVVAAEATCGKARAPIAQPVTIAIVFATMLSSTGAIAQESKLQGAAPRADAAGDEEAGDKDATREDGEEQWLPGEVGGSVALTSNYVDRGITQSGNDPAVQGALEYAAGTGIGGTKAYIGFWGSNVDLEGDRSTAHLEIDALFGIRGEIGAIGWDIGGAYYVYPGTRSADDFDYWEIPIVLAYAATDRLTFELVNLFAPENQFNTGLGNYITGNVYYDIPVPYVGLQLFAGVGYQYIEDDFNGTDWRLGTTVTVKGIDLSVAFTDTDYRARECGNNQCNAKVVFTVAMEF